jgi:hypothetical protein
MDFYRTVAPFAAASLSALFACLAFRHWLHPVNALGGIMVCTVVTLLTTIFVLAVIPAGRNALKDAVRSVQLLVSQKGESF